MEGRKRQIWVIIPVPAVFVFRIPYQPGVPIYVCKVDENGNPLAGAVLAFYEGDAFKIIIPLNAAATATVGPEQSRVTQTLMVSGYRERQRMSRLQSCRASWRSKCRGRGRR